MKTARANLDFYPTPGAVAHVLAAELVARMGGNVPNAWLDPAGGDGDLISGMRDVQQFSERHWTAIEIDAQHLDALESRADNVVIANALDVEWPEAGVVANPPFFALEQFWSRVVQHRNRYRTWCAVFTPVAWWQAERRANLTSPDVVLALNWRPVFRKRQGAAHKGSQDFVWAILTPVPAKVAQWLRAPKPNGKGEPETEH